jgi:hypothetical protein
MSEEVTLIREANNLDIFLLDKEGAVSHARVTGNGQAPGWKSLGGKLSTALQAFAVAEGEVHLLGVGSTGEVWHCTINESHASNSKANWNALGGSSVVQLSVLGDGKHGLVLFAVSEDRTVYKKSWDGKAWTPSGNDWKKLGGLDLLFSAPPA